MLNLTCKSEFIELFLRNNTFRIVSILLCYGSKAGLDFVLNLDNDGAVKQTFKRNIQYIVNNNNIISCLFHICFCNEIV